MFENLQLKNKMQRRFKFSPLYTTTYTNICKICITLLISIGDVWNTLHV